MRVTFLGTGDAWTSGGFGNSALLLESGDERLLVDCGPTVPLALSQRGLSAAAIGTILVTHPHGDHFAGLPFLLLAGLDEPPRSEPLLVGGPAGLARQVEAVRVALYPDAAAPPAYPTRFVEFAPEAALDLRGWSVQSRVARHMPAPFIALSYRIAREGKVLAVSGDTGYGPHLEALGADADMLVCECTLPVAPPDDPAPGHLTFADIAALRQRCRGSMVVTHLSALARARVAGLPDVTVATDGLVVEL